MKINSYGSGIYEVEEFLTVDEQNYFLNMVDGEWVNTHPGNIVKDLEDESRAKVDAIVDRLNGMFTNIHGFSSITNLRRLSVDESMPLHTDGGDPNDERVIVFGIAIYLNDDFDGGMLFYPDVDITVAPKARSIVIHDAKLSHGVKKVKSGNRYSITTFAFGDDNSQFLIR